VAANIAGTLVAEALAPGAGAQVRIGIPPGGEITTLNQYLTGSEAVL
jgi:hypothetical protein